MRSDARRRRRIGWALGLALGVAAWGGGASAAPCNPDELEARVAATGAETRPSVAPIELKLGLTLIDLISIDDAMERFRADLRLEMMWQDARFAPEQLGCDAAGKVLPAARIWQPEILLLNATDASESLGQAVTVGPGGRLGLIRRYQAGFSTPMELEDFPLETQELSVVLGTAFMGPSDLRVVVDEERSGVFEDASLAGWSISEAVWSLDEASIADRSINRVHFVFPVIRSPGFFAYKVILPLALIVTMSWAVFWIDPVHVEGQLGVASASVIALVAFQLSLGDLLPQIAYLTRMDRFVLGSTVLVFAALGEATTTSSLAARDRFEDARRLDRFSRYLFPASYGFFALWCFI